MKLFILEQSLVGKQGGERGPGKEDVGRSKNWRMFSIIPKALLEAF